MGGVGSRNIQQGPSCWEHQRVWGADFQPAKVRPSRNGSWHMNKTLGTRAMTLTGKRATISHLAGRTLELSSCDIVGFFSIPWASMSEVLVWCRIVVGWFVSKRKSLHWSLAIGKQNMYIHLHSLQVWMWFLWVESADVWANGTDELRSGLLKKGNVLLQVCLC